MTRLVPGETISWSTRKAIIRLIQSVSGQLDEAGAFLAGQRLQVMAPEDTVTTALAAFVDRAIALATPHCPRCLDLSVGLCPPCRREHAAEMAALVTEDGATPLRDRLRSCDVKRRYDTQADALAAAARAWESRRVKLRSYHCEFCEGHHLTKSRALRAS